MAIKKYLSLDKLTEYDALLKAKIAADDAAILEQAKTDASNKDAVVLAETQKSINAVQLTVDTLSDNISNLSNHNHDNDYDAKGAADTALATAKTYADGIKNDLLNGAGTAYDTLKELGDLIDDNKDAIDALEEIASGKANATHAHAISDVTNLQTTLNNASSAISANTNSINAHTDRISALETKVGDGFQEITSAEIQALFA